MASEYAKDVGVEFVLDSDRKYFTCNKCGGIISIHTSECSDCCAKLADMRLGPYAQFGIIDCLDEKKNYALTETFEECLKIYRCMGIPDDVITDWESRLENMKTYYHEYSRPATGFSRYGVTLIPPESLDLFASVIKTHTSERFSELCKKELDILLTMLKEAKEKDKFIIHFGI